MTNRKAMLPHAAVVHKVKAYWHPSLRLWSATPGEEYTFEVFGAYGRSKGENAWVTDLIQRSGDELEWQDKKSARSLVGALAWALKWITPHFAHRRGGFGGYTEEHLSPEQIVIRNPGIDVISYDREDT